MYRMWSNSQLFCSAFCKVSQCLRLSSISGTTISLILGRISPRTCSSREQIISKLFTPYYFGLDQNFRKSNIRSLDFTAKFKLKLLHTLYAGSTTKDMNPACDLGRDVPSLSHCISWSTAKMQEPPCQSLKHNIIKHNAPTAGGMCNAALEFSG